MSISKQIKDRLVRTMIGKASVPSGLFELSQYFYHYGPINFEFKQENNVIVALSTNFRYGSIVTSGKNSAELDKNIKDAILTAFEIPSSYEKEANVKKETEFKYAIA